jgi:DNA modification methylase
VLREDKPTSADLHPTMKPVALLRHLIHNSSERDDVVLDLFAGSGSTLIAAEQAGRRCLAMELDPAYCDVIRRRYETSAGAAAA